MVKKTKKNNSKKNNRILKKNISKKYKNMLGGSKLLLQDRDDKTYELELKDIEIAGTIKALLPEFEDEEMELSSNPIPLPAVPVDLFQPLVDYMKGRSQLGNEQEKEELDKKFVNDISVLGDDKLFELINAVNYLDMKELLDCACEKVASYIRECRTPQEIRERFNIHNDFTPEEEEKIKEENAWAFQE